MIRAAEMKDTYRDGRLVCRWSLVDGYPRCIAAPLDVTTATQAEIAGQIAVNRAVRAKAAEADAYEAAQRLAATDEPPATILEYDADGVGVPVPNPAWEAWSAAGALLQGASPELLHLVRTRADALERDGDGNPVEPPYSLDLPDLPAFDPVAETADWSGSAWEVRAATPGEAAVIRAALAVRYPRVMTPRDFWTTRLMPAECLAISAAARASSEAMAGLVGAAGANYIDLDSPDTAYQLGTWVAAGLLTEPRMEAILAGEAVA
ncbi:MAG TPA: hypothetical protein VEB20_03250 [Azospirillaceae bacterium]|nr:hypothetical protein [Azospirillaceae bacterium]